MRSGRKNQLRRPVVWLGAAATAALLILAMPGLVGWWPLLFVALVPLLLVLVSLPPGYSFILGTCCGLLHYTALFYWIVIVLGRYGNLPFWLSGPALFLLALYMACYCGVFSMLLSLLAGRYWQKERSLASFVWLAPILWTGLDYLRSFLFTGFPWMDMGYGLAGQPRLIQAADLGGHHLVTFCLVLVNALVVFAVDRQKRGVRWNRRQEKRWILAACSLLVFIAGYSQLRYQQFAATMDRELHAEVAVIQGNFLQDEKWEGGLAEETVKRYCTLTRRILGDQTTELVVWPETAMPFYLQRNPLAARLANLVQEENVYLLTGAPWYLPNPAAKMGKAAIEYFNSALLLDPEAKIVGRYDKQHLVPFGEYVPLRHWLGFLEPLVESIGDFTPGDSSAPLEAGTLRLGVLICFESIFPDIARKEVMAGANLLVNLTNDAWYGRSSAPYHSLAMAVFRAVENRRSLVRAANTGISGFIDPLGRVRPLSPLFSPWSAREQVVMYEGKTVFSRFGYRLGPVCLAILSALLVFRPEW